jgi:hypothetical protein
MKQGKCLKRRHKTFLSNNEYNPKDYLITKDTSTFMEFVNRLTGKRLVIKYEN